MRHKIIYTVLFMFAITAVYTGALAVMHDQTYAQIQDNQVLKEQKSILYIFNIPFQEDASIEQIQSLYQKHIKYHDQREFSYFEGMTADNEIIGYAFPMEGNGLWGKIEGYLALSKDRTTILGLDFTSHSETPGLGGRISEDWFKEQFRGIQLEQPPRFISFRDQQEIDSISGATQTSQAVENIVNHSISMINERMAVN